MAPLDSGWWQAHRPSPLAVDVALAGVLSVGAVAEWGNDSVGTSFPFVLLMTVPLVWRRRYPLPIFCFVVIALLTTADAAPVSAFLALLAVTYAVAAYGRYRFLSLAAVVATAWAIFAEYGGDIPLPSSAVPFAILVPLWLAGQMIRTRQLRAEASEDRAARLEREQELMTRAALAEERSRIARELHDVVAHNVSVMVVQAGAARQVLTTAPEEARQALLAVEGTGREAMAELRNLLGVLSEDGEQAALAPQPGVDQIEPLVHRVRDAGLPVSLRVEGQARSLPTGVDLAAYRIVQEALTNALKYSGLAPTEVILDYRDDELKVEVLDEGAARDTRLAAGAGHGLVGMRERVALYGGTLEAGPRPGRGYAVRAWLPFAGSRA